MPDISSRFHFLCSIFVPFAFESLRDVLTLVDVYVLPVIGNIHTKYHCLSKITIDLFEQIVWNKNIRLWAQFLFIQMFSHYLAMIAPWKSLHKEILRDDLATQIVCFVLCARHPFRSSRWHLWPSMWTCNNMSSLTFPIAMKKVGGSFNIVNCV